MTSAMSPFSIEVTPAVARHVQKIAPLKGLLPKPKVFVTVLPEAPLSETIETVHFVRQHGLLPVPHIPARSFESVADVEAFLEACGPLEEVLVVGGERSPPRGETLHEAMDVVRAGILEKHGVRRVGFACHPQGAANIGDEALDNAFREKVEWAKNWNDHHFEEVYFVTQLCSCAESLMNFERRAREEMGNFLPLYVGLAGPSDPEALVKYFFLFSVGR